jgi:methionyl-tRNA synthetase
MALDLPLPKQVFGHPWLLSGLDKMSKSRGNVLYADKLVELFGVDAIRYYVLHEIPFANDGTITYDLIIEKINSDLANVLGNLVNRTISMANKYFDGKVTNKKVSTEFDCDLISIATDLESNVDSRMNKLEIGAALDEIFELLRRSNKYIDETLPWALAKEESEKDKLETVIYNLLESIRIAAVNLRPFLPETSEEIFRQLNNTKEDNIFLQANEYNTVEPKALFQRIDKEKKLKEIEESE